ncbi:MAG: TolC family protein [Myxococcota bacterium]
MHQLNTGRNVCVFCALVAIASPRAHAGNTEPAQNTETPEPFDLDAALANGGIPLTADFAAQRAVAASPTVERAYAAVEVARVGARLSWSGFVPHMELSARYTRVGGFDDGIVQIGPSGGVDPVETQTLLESVSDPAARQLLTGVLAQQQSLGGVQFHIPRNQAGLRSEVLVPVSEWFTTVLPSLRAAHYRITAEKHAAAATEADIALAACEAFYRYVQARASLEVAQASTRQAHEHVDRLTAMSRAGLVTEADKLEAQSHLAATRSRVIRVQGGVDIARAVLESLLRMEAPTGFSISGSLDDHVPPAAGDRAELVRLAWQQRPEVQAIQAGLDGRRHQVDAAEGERYPRLVATAGYDYAQPNPLIIPPQERFDSSWRVGVALIWSPDTTLRAHYQADLLGAELTRTRVEQEILRDRVRTEVIDAHARYEAARSSLEAAIDARRAAENGYQARLAEIRSGQAVTTEIIDADFQVAGARLGVVDAAVAVRIAHYSLERAVGSPIPSS